MLKCIFEELEFEMRREVNRKEIAPEICFNKTSGAYLQ